MPFFLLPAEGLPDGLRRIALEQIDYALGLLEGKGDIHVAIHETRKTMKRLRAIMRLVRDQLGTETYRAANAQYRDLARTISGLRDLSAMQETLEKLRARTRSKILAGLISQGQSEIQQRLDAVATSENETTAAHVQSAIYTLQAARAELMDMDLGRDRFKTIGPSLKRVYHRGYKGLRQARREPTTEQLHQWRKRVKYLWYQMDILHPIWPGLMVPWAEELHSLSEWLGTDHDLAILMEQLESGHLLAGRQKGKAQLQRLITIYREELMGDILPLGHRLYSLPPKAFTRLIGHWHTTWHRYPDAQVWVPALV